MKANEVKLRITLLLDEKWLSNLTEEGLRDYLQGRLNSSLGFRGQVKRFSLKMAGSS